jgi:hypothetical protein
MQICFFFHVACSRGEWAIHDLAEGGREHMKYAKSASNVARGVRNKK